uniref:PTS transporter subunit EIIC n=1 Tax=Terrisporobacter sp. TaxID=1965305 RepID=UPI0026279725
YDIELPDYLGAFKGSAFVVMIGFFVMIPVALGVAVVWPKVQYGMIGLQEFFKNSGTIGVGAYVLLQKLLLPLGLHHFIYAPVLFDSVIVEGGTIAYWANHLNEFVSSTAPLIELYPMGGFSNGELAKVFGVIGVAWAFYSTAKPNKKKMVLAIMIPATLTSIMTGITEPLEFTFLFVAPVLYIVYSILAAVMAMVTLAFGIIGNFGTGLPNIIFMNIIPLFKNREMMYLTLLLLGIAFIFIHYIVFKFMILKFDYKTPGREDDEDEIKLYTKDDYNSKNNKGRISSTSGIDENLLIEALGGKDNILEISNCATRLRLAVADENLVKDLNTFKKLGAVGLVKSGKSIQVIIGLNVPKVRENIEMLIS